MNSKFKVSFLFFFLFSIISFAQNGVVRGTIKDAATDEDIIGATVKIDGSTLGAATDINGFFSIAKVPVGKKKVVISYVSYKTKEIEINVEADKVIEINTTIQEDKVVLQEVKVVANRITGTEVSVISEIKASQMVVSGISSAQIGKTLDRNAAEVVKRVPGVTIFGNRFINIRGLNERYNTVMLNNVFTPSMETDVRSFSFDIIPSNQIDRILVFKSPAAELPAEFSGGVVKIFTKSIPDQNFLTVDMGGSYREGTTSKDFYEPQHGANYWTGFNDGYSDLPKYFPATKADIINAGADRLAQIGQMLKNNWTPLQSKALPDLRFSMTGGFKIQKGELKIGNFSAVNYSNSYTNFEMQRNDYEFSQIMKNGEAGEVFNFNDKQYTHAVRLGVLHNWAFRLNEKNTIEFKNLFNQLSNGQFVNRTGFDSGNKWNIRSFDQVYRGIYSGQLVGKHTLVKDKTNIDWVVGYNNSYRDQPDYKRFRYNLDGTTPILLVPQGSAQTFNLGRTNIQMTEASYTAGVNLVQKIVVKKAAQKEDNKELELKAGVYYELKDRQFDARNLGYVQASSANFNIGSLPIEQIFAPGNINNTTGVKIDEQTNPNDSYTAKNTLLAYYVSGNYSLTKKLNAIVGVRVENNTQKLDSYDLVNNPLKYNNPKTNILPSTNVTYNFSEKSLLRVAYGQTLNRPEFREIAPFSFYDFVNNRNITGNPNLRNAQVQNVDFRYEFYPTPAEVVSIAAFYKKFTNPIEVVFASGSNPNLSFANAASAFSSGIELETRKSLEGLTSSPFLNKLNVTFNAAFIYSRVKLSSDIAANQSNNRPLQGQSPYVINGGLGYNDAKKQLQINILYNVIGKRIYAVGNNYGYQYPDWYEMPRNVVDVTFSKGIGKNLVLKGGITDVLNARNLVLQDGNQDGKFDINQDQVIQSYRAGRVYSLGVAYTFSKK
ncbi:outer membrane protein [Emticicia aquatilis]|uniref:Outer membrane protein n=1 Tax=Emticicia aquatilis TaxID=1537369 RepID=A0A916YGY0_9BACT|nr:TonB-dependent receptor [Emticicia aquatilis]GGD44166.1 outer membrane protein [Emticicia aquatilis]